MKNFIFPSILKDSFAGCSNFGWQVFSLEASNKSLEALLAFRVSAEKSSVTLRGLPL